jgi:hypothetical protein
MSISPGSKVIPGRSMRRAPAGMTGRAAPRPTTDAIRPSVITTTGSSITRPASTSIIRSAVTTTVSAFAVAGMRASKSPKSHLNIDTPTEDRPEA